MGLWGGEMKPSTPERPLAGARAPDRTRKLSKNGINALRVRSGRVRNVEMTPIAIRCRRAGGAFAPILDSLPTVQRQSTELNSGDAADGLGGRLVSRHLGG